MFTFSSTFVMQNVLRLFIFWDCSTISYLHLLMKWDIFGILRFFDACFNPLSISFLSSEDFWLNNHLSCDFQIIQFNFWNINWLSNFGMHQSGIELIRLKVQSKLQFIRESLLLILSDDSSKVNHLNFLHLMIISSE